VNLLCKPRVFRPLLPPRTSKQQNLKDEGEEEGKKPHNTYNKRNRVATLWLVACRQQKTTDQPRDYESAAFLTAYNKNPPSLYLSFYTSYTTDQHREKKTEKISSGIVVPETPLP
jgi:hypothetical protein